MSKSKEERATDFYNYLVPYVTNENRQMLREFYDYWTESSPTGKKLRFEMEKVFDVSKRIAYWSKRSGVNFNSPTVKSRLQNIKEQGDIAEQVLRQKYANE